MGRGASYHYTIDCNHVRVIDTNGVSELTRRSLASADQTWMAVTPIENEFI